ncbi:MAG TPA: fimbria/pilus periplasmic chaperone [Sphingomicrobium sp.]|jgi:P pilus assembly chaperone PapD|nr:fimbria/pilus periplasmic chaperone [Sphingomicrobium sp.]
MKWVRISIGTLLLIAADILAPLGAARADLLLSQLVVELAPHERARADVEIWNSGTDRAFVAVDPREIIDPGTPRESSRNDPDPEKLGLLVSPERIVLEPGQRRLLRIASLAESDRERVYRVTVKPVVGQLSSDSSGLKLLVGYDMLVLVRPAEARPHVSGTRSAGRLTLKNDGNLSVELVDGKACGASIERCTDLPGGRLYAGAEKTVEIVPGERVDYKLKVGSKLLPVEF